jgi:hypothetical protein
MIRRKRKIQGNLDFGWNLEGYKMAVSGSLFHPGWLCHLSLEINQKISHGSFSGDITESGVFRNSF